MANPLDQILERRRRRLTRAQQARYLLFSVVFHLAVAAGVWFVPDLLARPPQRPEYVSVMVVTPQILGIEEPTPASPPPPETEPEPAPPPPPPPEPESEPESEPEPSEVPVLPQEEPRREPEPSPPPTRATPPPPEPAPVTPPPKRRGSPFGSSMGSATSNARVGAEDPNFTYGYYLDRVVAVISNNWVRPPVGSDVEDALLYFRIQRDGALTDLRIVEPSGSEVFDQAAYRAVESSSPLPPLPKSYKRDFLGINLIVQ